MPRLKDLGDARRTKKPWLPADDRDVTNGLVKLMYSKSTSDRPMFNPVPFCSIHGAMNRVHPFEQYWRCSEQYCGIGAELIKE